MKRFFYHLTFTVSFLVFSATSFSAATVKTDPPVEKMEASQFAGFEHLRLEEFLSLTPKTIKEKTGRKLSLKEIIVLKKAQKQLKKAMSGNSEGGKNQLVALVLVIFIGWLGIHRFYLGYPLIGIIQVLTVGGCGIWALVDMIRIITGDLKPKRGEYEETL